MARAVMGLAGWTALQIAVYALGALALPRVSPALRRSAVLVPLLVAEVLLVGQINEPRWFDCYLPLLIAILLQGISSGPREVEVPPPGTRLTAA